MPNMPTAAPVWLNPFTGGYILMPASIWKENSRYVIGEEAITEAGGLLLGNYRGSHLEIVEATEPMAGDERRRFSFIRRDLQHSQIAKSAWAKSGKTTTMIGEWHTHPTSYPVPSVIDTSSWQKITSTSSRLMFFLILGSRGHWSGMVQTGKDGVKLRRAMPLFDFQRCPP